MLTITIPGKEIYNEKTNMFSQTSDTEICLEHSLISLSKWESIYHVPFIGKKDLTEKQIIDYIKCMTLTQKVDPNIYYCLTQENVNSITKYIEDSMTATWFNDHQEGQGKITKEQITSELIYCWMVQLQIPWEAQKWHLNRLLTLIRVCNIKNQPQKKMNKNEILRNQAALNAQRRAKLGSKG